MLKYNFFHLVRTRLWPLLTSLSFLTFGLGVVIIVTKLSWQIFIFSLMILSIYSYLWGTDIHSERCYEGRHNKETTNGFKSGILIFILSECFFFLGIFWAYMHLAEAPAIEVGSIWPSLGVTPFDPKGIPFLNTILLVTSGVTVTWSHHALEEKQFKKRIKALFITIALGLIFTSLQLMEYYTAEFTFACSSYSSIYFIGTGFHGLHVIIGTTLLVICLSRLSNIYVRPKHSIGYECSIWYWHFVDIVWFCLYLVFYWWGN
jgi:cytochrome c oxidase subunit 3